MKFIHSFMIYSTNTGWASKYTRLTHLLQLFRLTYLLGSWAFGHGEFWLPLVIPWLQLKLLISGQHPLSQAPPIPPWVLNPNITSVMPFVMEATQIWNPDLTWSNLDSLFFLLPHCNSNEAPQHTAYNPASLGTVQGRHYKRLGS